jgi:hypothetical protein
MSTLLLNERRDRGLVDSMKTRQEQSQTQSALIRPITQQVSIDKMFIRGYFWSNLWGGWNWWSSRRGLSKVERFWKPVVYWQHPRHRGLNLVNSAFFLLEIWRISAIIFPPQTNLCTCVWVVAPFYLSPIDKSPKTNSGPCLALMH